jgi:uncharacterized protein YneF (UPF0154 family)
MNHILWALCCLLCLAFGSLGGILIDTKVLRPDPLPQPPKVVKSVFECAKARKVSQ